MKVLFYLQDGVEVLDFAGPMEVFAAAGLRCIYRFKNKKPDRRTRYFKITPDYSITDAPNADIVAFFCGNSGAPVNDPAVIEWKKNKITSQYYVSVCTGAFVLGKAGLLDNLTVTTCHESIENLKKAVPKVKVLSNVRFVDNGNIITTAGIDGALHIVAKLKGPDAAIEVAKYIEHDNWVPDNELVSQKDIYK